MPARSSPTINKHKPIKKRQKHSTTTHIFSSMTSITNNFFSFLRDVAHPRHPRPTNPMISFLNLSKAKKQSSLNYIPSIQNMISQQNIEGDNPNESISSIQRGFSQDIISEHNYELKVIYICLLERIMKRLHNQTSESQRKKIIRGTWNILNKYSKDFNYFVFTNIGTKIQWGLLELINFNFQFSNKEKFLAQNKLNIKRSQNEVKSLTHI